MGELGEGRWAVMSERGREASGLRYDEAIERERALKTEGVSGLCIVTDEAASRLPNASDAEAAEDEERSRSDRAKRTRRRAGEGKDST